MLHAIVFEDQVQFIYDDTKKDQVTMYPNEEKIPLTATNVFKMDTIEDDYGFVAGFCYITENGFCKFVRDMSGLPIDREYVLVDSKVFSKLHDEMELKYEYSIPIDSCSHDYGTVKAKNLEEAKEKILKQVKSDFDMMNQALGKVKASIDYQETDLVITNKK